MKKIKFTSLFFLSLFSFNRMFAQTPALIPAEIENRELLGSHKIY